MGLLTGWKVVGAPVSVGWGKLTRSPLPTSKEGHMITGSCLAPALAKSKIAAGPRLWWPTIGLAAGADGIVWP